MSSGIDDACLSDRMVVMTNVLLFYFDHMKLGLFTNLEAAALPDGLILRTPPGSPLHNEASVPSLQPGSSMNGLRRKSLDESTMNGHLSTSRLTAHRERALFNQFMPELLGLGQPPYPR